MLNLPNAYFPSFDHVVRKSLDPVWHKVGPTTKALVKDLAVLRRLVVFLLYYDPLQFHAYCETLIATHRVEGNNASAGGQWMLSDAANIIFSVSRALSDCQRIIITLDHFTPKDSKATMLSTSDTATKGRDRR